MPSDTTYNGWKNYETWAVGMYLDGNYDGEGTYLAVLDLVRETAENATEKPGIWTLEQARIFEVEDALKAWFEECLPNNGGSIVDDLLSSAVDEVDWRELAESKLQEISEAWVEEQEGFDGHVDNDKMADNDETPDPRETVS